MLGTSLLWRSTVAFTYLKVKSIKCICLLPVVLVLLFWSWSWSCYFGLGLKFWSCLGYITVGLADARCVAMSPCSVRGTTVVVWRWRRHLRPGTGRRRQEGRAFAVRQGAAGHCQEDGRRRQETQVEMNRRERAALGCPSATRVGSW